MAGIVKFSEETRILVVCALLCGVSKARAAELAGITRMTLYRWLQQGQRDEAAGLDTEYACFAAVCRRAEAQVIAAVECGLVEAAIGGDWRAAAWYLSKKLPLEYGSASNVLKTAMANELLDELGQRISAAAFEEVLGALTAEDHPKALAG